MTPAVSASTVYNSAAYEIHAHFADPKNDIPLLINKALERIPLIVSFNFAPVANTMEQDLTAQQSWLTNRAWVRRVDLLAEGGDQVQTITEAGSPSGGTFTLTYRGNTSGNIAYDATASTVQTALRLLENMGSVTVTRTGTSTNFVWEVTMTGSDPYMPIMTANASGLTGGSSPTITPEITTDRGTLLSLDGTAVKRSDRVYLQTTRQFQTTDRLYVTCIKPAYFHCRSSSTGTFGERSGLSAEAHECVPDEDWVGFGALTILARRELSTISKPTESAIALQGPRWARTFQQLSRERWETERDAQLLLEPVLAFGPSPAGFRRTASRPSWWN